jgi:hypothetical protein
MCPLLQRRPNPCVGRYPRLLHDRPKHRLDNLLKLLMLALCGT